MTAHIDLATHKSAQRKLPPYGRELAARLRAPTSFKNYIGTSADGKAPTLWLACGPGSWDWARRNQGRRILTIVPPSEDPSAYDWSSLKGHDPVYLVSCGHITQAELRAIVAAVMRDGVRRVVHGGNDCVTVYRRKGGHAND